MPDFSHREKELRDSFEADKADFKVGEQVECFVRLRDAYPVRAAALADMLVPLTDMGAELKTRAFEDKFQVYVDRWVMPLTRLCDGLLYPGEEIDWWREREVGRELTFMQGLINMEIAEARDEMVALQAGLEKLMADLDKKWGTMTEEARRLEAEEAQACARMNEIMRQGVNNGTDAWARYGDALKRFLDVFMQIPDFTNAAVVGAAKQAGIPDKIAEAIPKVSLMGKDYFAYGKELGIPAAELARANPELFRDPGMFVSESIQKQLGPYFEALVTALNALYKYVLPVASMVYAEQVGQLQRLMPNQGVILVSLTQTRRDVDDFLKNCGLDKARAVYDRAEAALSRWADGQPTDGLKADAREWAAVVLEAFKRRYEHMATLFGVFVQANQGRFIGPVSRSVENELIFTDVWADRTQGLMDIGMDERLREWRAGAIDVSDRLATASSQVYQGLRHLPMDIQDGIVSKLNAYWAQLGTRLKAEADQAAAAMATAENNVNDGSIKRDLDRSALRQRLTA